MQGVYTAFLSVYLYIVHHSKRVYRISFNTKRITEKKEENNQKRNVSASNENQDTSNAIPFFLADKIPWR